MLQLKRTFLFFFLLNAFSSFSQLKTVTNKTTYPFWIQIPEKQSDEKLPLFLFLHGKSLSGKDIQRVKQYGVLRAIEKGRKIPAIVVAPQLASGSWNPEKVFELIEYLQKNYSIDEQRIYLCGISLGGYGTLHFAGKYPDKLTAAVAICGGGNEKDGCRLATVPFWIQHGDVENIVPLSESQKMYDAIKKCNINADVTLTVIKGGNHGSVEGLFHQDELYEWLFNKSRKSP